MNAEFQPTSKQTRPKLIEGSFGTQWRRLGNSIGKGGFAEAYLVENTRKHGGLAVAKLFNPDVDAQKVQHEIAMHEVINHPNAVELYDSFVATDPNQQSALIMEYAPWGNFKELRNRGGLPLPEVFPYLVQSLHALIAMHKAGIAWNDAKPANILLGLGGVKISDFGIASKLDEKPTLVQGTPVYMAPEQFSLQGATERSDLHSMTLTMYHLLTGTPPFEGTIAQIIALKRMSNHMLRPFIDEMGDRATPQHKAIADVMEQGMEADPANRQETVEKFTEELVTKYHGAKAISYFDVKPADVSEFNRKPRDKEILAMIAELRAMQAETPDKTVSDGMQRIELSQDEIALVQKKGSFKNKLAAWIGATTAAISLGLGGLHLVNSDQEPNLSQHIGVVERVDHPVESELLLLQKKVEKTDKSSA